MSVTMTSFNFFFFAALSGVLFILFRWIRQLGRLPKGLPPGPPTIPILGNLHQLSLETGHKQMKAWADQYGSMYTLMMGPKQPVIVVSTERQVKALLVKRGSNFSSRPDHYMAHEVLSGGLRVIFMVRIPSQRLICFTSMNRLAHSCMVRKRNIHGISNLRGCLRAKSWPTTLSKRHTCPISIWRVKHCYWDFLRRHRTS